jgi:hypothetical protein
MNSITLTGTTFESMILANDTYNNEEIGVFFNSEASNLMYKTQFLRMLSYFDNMDLLYQSSKDKIISSNITFNIEKSKVAYNQLESV